MILILGRGILIIVAVFLIATLVFDQGFWGSLLIAVILRAWIWLFFEKNY